jgi:phosphate transport system substrate-binding protein
VVAAVVATVVHASVSTRPAMAAVTINGAGSTWSQIAVDQWRADVARQGLSINYQGTGSTSGRVFYYSDQVDFAVSEIPFQSQYRDATGTVAVNEVEKASHRPYTYLPIVAGGTSFMYHLDVAGRRITDLRLTPDTIAKIFTGSVRAWNDTAIQATNPNTSLPALPIRPVVRADGSGTTAQFTAYMASQTPDVWNSFCARIGLTNPCPATSLYPEFEGSVAQPLSDGVANFVSASYNNGTITYVEYGYAKQRGFPVASVRNRAGYFTQPTALNVAIALQGAQFNADGTQNLGGVYTFGDPNAYPVSSYSYMIAPTSEAAPFTRDKGEALGRFILYFVCAGQQKAEQLGYSPLPRNLVANAFDAIRRIPGAPAPPALEASACANPTLASDWPPRNVPPPNPSPTTTPATTPGGGQAADPSAGTAPGTRDAAGAGTDDGALASGAVVELPGGRIEQVAASAPLELGPVDDGIPKGVPVLAAGLVLAITIAPPLLSQTFRKRRRHLPPV